MLKVTFVTVKQPIQNAVLSPGFFQKVKVESQLLQGHWQQRVSKQDGLQFAESVVGDAF